MPETLVRIGVISDTHGTLPASAVETFQGVDAIIHAGDIGGEEILYDLESIAPVTAVRGNTDHQGPTWPLPEEAVLELGGRRILVTHIGNRGARRELEEAQVIVSGHTHRPEALWVGGQLHLNPGSATRSRTSGGRGTVAILTMGAEEPRAEIITLLQG